MLAQAYIHTYIHTASIYKNKKNLIDYVVVVATCLMRRLHICTYTYTVASLSTHTDRLR